MNLAVGNAVGSNITNVHSSLVSRPWWYPLPTTERSFRLRLDPARCDGWGRGDVYDGTLDFIDGVILISALTGYSLWLVKSARSGDESAEQSDEEKPM